MGYCTQCGEVMPTRGPCLKCGSHSETGGQFMNPPKNDRQAEWGRGYAYGHTVVDTHTNPQQAAYFPPAPTSAPQPPPKPEQTRAQQPVLQHQHSGGGGGGGQCAGCGKPVYFAERVQQLGRSWHRGCLRCCDCGTNVCTGLHEFKGEPYCSQCHYKRAHT